ncbi:MAG: hypothetical protein M3Q32_09945 [Pseudomonadota bacterium]|nr:hypothetical protein [Pseudomonadota bacterium]
MAENPNLLRVARPGECNTQQTGSECATASATTVEQTSLKALSLLALERNKRRNKSATRGEITMQQTTLKNAPFVACETSTENAEQSQVVIADAYEYRREDASLGSINENCAEVFSERAAIMEYDGGLSREEAEAAARDATEKYRRECFERLQRRADAILSLPTWEGRLKAIERHGQLYGEIAGQEMNNWIRGKSGLEQA